MDHAQSLGYMPPLRIVPLHAHRCSNAHSQSRAETTLNYNCSVHLSASVAARIPENGLATATNQMAEYLKRTFA